MTQSMQALLAITDYRRTKQIDYNEKHGITPTTVKRAIQESLHTILRGREIAASVVQEAGGDFDLTELLRELEQRDANRLGESRIRKAPRSCATRSWK